MLMSQMLALNITLFSEKYCREVKYSCLFSVPTGSPCNNYKGYCDVFHRCRGIDNDGPLARLKNLIFSEETLTNIVNFLSVSKGIVSLSVNTLKCYVQVKYILLQEFV